MSTPESRSADDVRRDIEAEREQLAQAVGSLREEADKARDVGTKLQQNLPAVAAGVFAVGFVLAGGVGGTARYFARRGREGAIKASLGRFRLIEND
jgi:hypothetical protein